jgi:L-arabinokinase
VGSAGRRIDRLGPSLVVACFYISGHGFGHASRDGELLRALHRRIPGFRAIVRTAAPAWLFGDLGISLTVEPAVVDTGMAQIDSLRIDEERTARDAAAFYADFERRATDEAGWLRRMGADVVIADIPPLAFAAAAAAGVPSVAIGNFTWDWIYAEHEAIARLAPGVVDTIRRAYALAGLTLRLPLHGGFEGMANVRDIPLIARRSIRDRDETRRLLGLDGGRPAVLPSFGGYGVDLPWDALERSDRFAVVRPTTETLRRAGLRYEDVVAAVDVVVSKPGYGIVSECAANGTSLLYASRGQFAEQEVFVRDMPAFVRCREIAHADLFSGRWDAAIEALLAQAPPASRLDITGADAAADAIVSFPGL